jgi:hypothetical protein
MWLLDEHYYWVQKPRLEIMSVVIWLDDHMCMNVFYGSVTVTRFCMAVLVVAFQPIFLNFFSIYTYQCDLANILIFSHTVDQ